MNNSEMGRTHTILLLERDISVQELLGEVLNEAGYLVVKHGYPVDPTEVSNLQPDLVVLDVPIMATCPELDFVSHLKTGAHTAHIPILALCKACPSTDVSDWTQKNGFAGFLRKPFDLDDFLDAVQSAIESVNIATLTARHESSMHHIEPETVRPPV